MKSMTDHGDGDGARKGSMGMASRNKRLSDLERAVAVELRQTKTMTDKCDHDWYLDSEIVSPLDAPMLQHSIFIECLRCDVIYRDNEIVEIWKVDRAADDYEREHG